MSNTIDDALEWLREATAKSLTPRELLWLVLYAGMKRAHKGIFGVPLIATPPIDAKFGVYRLDPKIGTRDGPFIRQFDGQWQTVSLWPLQIEQILHVGETFAYIAERPEDSHGQPDRYVLVEPLDTPLRVTLSMVRIPNDVLCVLADAIKAHGAPDDSAPFDCDSPALPDNAASASGLSVREHFAADEAAETRGTVTDPTRVDPTNQESRYLRIDSTGHTSQSPLETDFMTIAEEVRARYWVNHDPSDRDTWTPQAEILKWIRERHPDISDSSAKAVEKVACPVDRERK